MKLITLLLALSSCMWGAISANTVWEVRQPSNDTNGGGFVTGAAGTDMSLFDNKNAAGCTSCQSATDNISVTDGVAAGTTTLTSVTANFTSAIVGNIIYVQGGTGSITAGWYQVTTFTNSTTIVVDRSTGLTTGTGVTINVGGALASPGRAVLNLVNGNFVFIKYNASPFSVTSASATDAGVLSNSTRGTVSGYDSTRTACGTEANRPTIQVNASTATLVTAASMILCNLILDGNTQTAAKASAGIGGGYKLHFINFNTASSSSINCVYCTATTNSAAVFGTAGLCVYCEAYSNTATPFSVSCVGCISRSNSGATTHGYSVSGTVSVNSIAYSNGQDGFSSGTGSVVIVNSVGDSNARYGFLFGSDANKLSISNASYNNTTSATNGTSTALGFITITAGTPWVNAGSTDFTPNTTTNQGALLRSVAFPSIFPVSTTNNYTDVGATRHQDPSAGGAFGYVK